MPVLIEGLGHETVCIRLRCMNVLAALGERARPALIAMKAAAMKKGPSPVDYLNRMVQYVPERLEQ